jgi:hypothetical protein
MTFRLVGVGLAIGGIVLAVAAATSLTLARAAVLAPVLVVGVAAVLGLLVFWSRVALLSLREARRPRLVIVAALGFVGLLVALTLLGVELPRE